MDDDLSLCDVFNLDFCQDLTGKLMGEEELGRMSHQISGNGRSLRGGPRDRIQMRMPRSEEDPGCVEASEKRFLSKERISDKNKYIIIIA